MCQNILKTLPKESVKVVVRWSQAFGHIVNTGCVSQKSQLSVTSVVCYADGDKKDVEILIGHFVQ